MLILHSKKKEGAKMGKITRENSWVAIEAMVELSPCHTEFLENGISVREEQEVIRRYMETGSLS